MTCARCSATAQGFQPLDTVSTSGSVGRRGVQNVELCTGCMDLLLAFLFGGKS